MTSNRFDIFHNSAIACNRYNVQIFSAIYPKRALLSSSIFTRTAVMHWLSWRTLSADTPSTFFSLTFTQKRRNTNGAIYRYLSTRGVRSRGSWQLNFDEESKVRAAGPVILGPRNVLRVILRELWLLVVKPVLNRLAISVSCEYAP